MNWMDALICIVMMLGFIHGVLKGAIQEIFVILALVIGVIAAGRATFIAESVTSQLAHPTAAKVFVFALTFLVVAIVIGLIGRMFSGLAKAASLKSIDRLIGGIVGACLVGIAVGVVLSVAQRLGMDTVYMQESVLVRQLILAVKALARFLPKASESIKTACLFI